MMSLLLLVLILGVIFWVISALPIAEPFKMVAYAILVIILLVQLFGLLGVTNPLLR